MKKRVAWQYTACFKEVVLLVGESYPITWVDYTWLLQKCTSKTLPK